MLFPLITIPYISRVLDPQGLGKVSFIDSFSYFFVVIAEAGVVTYGIREVARRRDDAAAMKEIVSDLLMLHIRTSLVALLVYIGFASLAYSRVQDERLIWFSVSFLVVNAFSCEWYFWGRENFRHIAVRSLVIRVLGLVSIFLLVNQPADYFIYYAIIVLSAIGTVIWNMVVLLREVPLRPARSGWRKHLPRTLVMYGISLTYSVMIMLDSVILGFAVSATAVSFYALAIRIARISTNFITDPLLVFYPNMVRRLSTGEEEGYRRLVFTSFQWLFLLTIPLGAGIFILSDSFTGLYLGEAFFPVSDCLKILAFYPLVKSIGLFLNKQVLLPHDREGLVLRGLFITMLVFIPLAFVLSYHYSFIGACYAIMLAECLTTALNLYYARSIDSSLRIFEWRSLLHAFLGSLFFIPVVFFFQQTGAGLLMVVLLSVLCCMVLYLLWLSVVMRNRVVLEFINDIRSFISARKKKNGI